MIIAVLLKSVVTCLFLLLTVYQKLCMVCLIFGVLTPPCALCCFSISSFRFVVIVQNPGRVVTLIHQEDWAAFSGAVSCLSAQGRTPSCPLPLPATLPKRFARRCDLYQVDPFPHEDIVWGTLRAKLAGLSFLLPRLNPPFHFPDYFECIQVYLLIKPRS